jgi:hypothetical protein
MVSGFLQLRVLEQAFVVIRSKFEAFMLKPHASRGAIEGSGDQAKLQSTPREFEAEVRAPDTFEIVELMHLVVIVHVLYNAFLMVCA